MKIGDKHICPYCGSSNVTSLGRTGYKQGRNGFGDKTIQVSYQCNSCHEIFHE